MRCTEVQRCIRSLGSLRNHGNSVRLRQERVVAPKFVIHRRPVKAIRSSQSTFTRAAGSPWENIQGGHVTDLEGCGVAKKVSHYHESSLNRIKTAIKARFF